MDIILELCDINCVPALVVSVFVASLTAAIYLLNANKTETPSLKKTLEKVPSSSQKSKQLNDPASVRSEIKGIKKESVKKAILQNGNAISSDSTSSRKATQSVKKVGSLKSRPSKQISSASNNGDIKSMQSKLKKAKQFERDEFVDAGEWQTVLTKKQKKQQQLDPLIQAVADVASAASSVPKVTKQNALKKEKKLALLRKSANEPTKPTIALQEVVLSVSDAPVSGVSFSSVQIQSPENSIHLKLDSVFKEFVDTEWKETKSQKKSKRRALKE